MRGDDRQQTELFSYISTERRVPQDHPLRSIRRMVDAALEKLSPRFKPLYSSTGRPSIAPEKLLRALVLQVMYTIRSERLLIEQLDYNLLFRWFVGLSTDDPVWDATTFTKNRERLLEGDIARAFLEEVLEQARAGKLLCDEHFTVDGTLIEAWAGHKSFKPKDANPTKPPDDPGNPTVDFTGQKRSNKTHASTTDPDSRLYRKSNGTESKLSYGGHILMDNRHGLAADARLTKATGMAEREAAEDMVVDIKGFGNITLGADKAYDVSSFVRMLEAIGLKPHIARKNVRYSTVPVRTTRQKGYAISQRKRKRIEEIFGWLKTIGLMRKTRHRGERRVGWIFTFAVSVYNLIRMRKLLDEAA